MPEQMPGKPLDKMLRRVQSMTRRTASQEILTSDASNANGKDFKSGSSDASIGNAKHFKSGSDKMLRRVQSMTRRTASQEILTSDARNANGKDFKSGSNDASIVNAKDFKSGSKRFGSGRMIGVFAVLKSSVPNRTKSLSRLDSLPGDIPQGCLAVYVGPERRRFVISTKYLSHQLFKALLKRCEEEFGFHHEGGLTIATCDPLLFQHLIWLIETNNPAAKTSRLEELMDCYPSQCDPVVGIQSLGV